MLVISIGFNQLFDITFITKLISSDMEYIASVITTVKSAITKVKRP